MAMELRKLSIDDGQDVYEMLQEIPAEENGFFNSLNGASYEEYKTWLVQAAENAKKTEIEDGWRVPQSTYWFYVDGMPVGICRFRHFLTDKLRKEGGHIGYAVRPSMRGHGYGTLMLRQLLAVPPTMGVHRVLLSTHPDNLTSQRVILANGGQREIISPDRCHFWIDCP